MAQTAHSLVPVNPKSLMSIDPQKNWRRYPSVPISKAMTDPAYIFVPGYVGGSPNVGAASGNNGETGTINSTHTITPYLSQGAKATALGTTIAPDITKSYHGTRGAMEPFVPVKVAAGKPVHTSIPVAFLPAQLIGVTPLSEET